MNRQTLLCDYVLKNVCQINMNKINMLSRGCHQFFELYSGLHPDVFDTKDSVCLWNLKPVCAETWRSAENTLSTFNLENMCYINKMFRKLFSGSIMKSGQCAISNQNVFQS